MPAPLLEDKLAHLCLGVYCSIRTSLASVSQRCLPCLVTIDQCAISKKSSHISCYMGLFSSLRLQAAVSCHTHNTLRAESDLKFLMSNEINKHSV